MIDASKFDFWREQIIQELPIFVLVADRVAKYNPMMLDKTKTRRRKAQAALYLPQNTVNKMNDFDGNYCIVKTNMAEIVNG